MEKAKYDNIFKNGLDNCSYNIDGYGEFHDGDRITHYLSSFDYKKAVFKSSKFHLRFY